jgi:hypothetical protein
MRLFTYATAVLLFACVAATAQAADKSNPCTLLDWQDLQAFGANKDTQLTDAGWHQEDTPKEIPRGKLFTNMCAIAMKSAAGRSSVTLSFDSFKGKVTEQQVAKWLKGVSAAIAADAEASEAKPVAVTLGETTCESGQYELPTAQEDGSIANVVEQYIACDRQVGTHHVSLNVQLPDAQKNVLPSPEEAKALLDKSIARMKKQAFSSPDNAA